jgi:hypothetical protein
VKEVKVFLLLKIRTESLKIYAERGRVLP